MERGQLVCTWCDCAHQITEGVGLAALKFVNCDGDTIVANFQVRRRKNGVAVVVLVLVVRRLDIGFQPGIGNLKTGRKQVHNQQVFKITFGFYAEFHDVLIPVRKTIFLHRFSGLMQVGAFDIQPFCDRRSARL